VVIAGTCAEYRWSGEPCVEGRTETAPASLYGACKHALHVAADGYARQAGISLAWGRLFFLYGPGERPQRLVPSVAMPLLAGAPAACSHGRQVRDFLYVDDAAAAFVALLDSAVRGPVNIASGVPTPVAEVVETIGRLTGRGDLVRLGALPSAADDPPLIVADVRRLRDEVGWRPRLDLERGLELTVDSLRAAVPA
jgi:nucleoside-diphosphate-sugar epimerase